jgi:hypothetical protein
MGKIISIICLLISFSAMEAAPGEIIVKTRTGDLKIIDPQGNIKIIKQYDKIPDIPFGSTLEALSGEFIIRVGTTHTIFLRQGQSGKISKPSQENINILPLKDPIKGIILTPRPHPTMGSPEMVPQDVVFTPPIVGPPSAPLGAINFPIAPEQASPYMPR